MATEVLDLRDDVVARLCRRPFKPFVVELGDGTRHFILRVAQMAVGLTTGIIGDPSGDSTRHIKIAEITQVKDI